MRIANIRSHLRAALEYSALALAVAAGLWSGSAQAQVTRTYTNGQTIATPYSTSAPNDPTTLTIASGSAVQSGILSGSGAVIKSGAGQVKLSAVNTYSGGTTINAGTLFLDVQQDAALGTGPVTLNSGGTLYLERINATNALTVNGGRIHADNGFGDSWGGPVTLNADMVIDSPGYATLTFKSTIGGTGGITLTGQGPVVLQVANTYTGPTSVTACTLECKHQNALGGGALSISSTANSRVNLNYSGTRNIASLTLGGVPQSGGTHGSSASPATNKNDTYFSGSGTVTVPLSPAKDILTFSFGGLGAAAIGATTVNLDVPFGTDRTALAPTFTLSPGATCSPVSGATRNFTSAQTYTVTAQDGSTTAYTVTVTEAILPNVFTWVNAAGGNWSAPANWTNEESIVAAPQAGGRATYTLNFNTAGTYTATNNLNAGFLLNRLNLASAVTLAGNSLAFTTNGTTLPQLNQNSASGVTISTPLNLASALTIGGTGNGPVTLSAPITGAGSLTKNGAGTLTISNASNTFSGGTTINAGQLTMNVQANAALGTGPVTLNAPATLFLERINATNPLTLNGGTIIASNGFGDSWNGTVALNASTTVNAQYNMSFGGAISGAGGFIKTGGNQLTLAGSNSFTGAMAVQAGTLAAASLNRISGGTATSGLGAPTTAANGTISLGAGTTAGTLLYSGPGETTDRAIKLAGTTGGATLSQSGTPAGFPTSRGESGLLRFTSDVSIPGTPGVDNRKTLTLTHVASTATGANPGGGEISGSIGDSLAGTTGQLATSITKAGVGTWTLSGANTYSGATKVQSGTLAFSRSDSLGGGTLDITTGAKVRLDYIGTRQISALTFNAGAPLPAGTYGSSSSIATHPDDASFAGLGTVTVGAVISPTTTTLARTAGNEPADGGESVTFTATVAGTAPAGNVRFYDGLTLIGTATLDGALQASLTTSVLGGGVHAITAQYVGNAGAAPSASAALTQTVVETRAATTTTLTSGANPSERWAPVTFTATVTGAAPTGSVTFFDDATALGTATLNGSAQASLTTSSLAVGWRAITARYAGDPAHAPSASATPLFQTVRPPAGNGKVKVFILAGQSNMVAYGSVENGRDPNNLTGPAVAGGLGSLRNMLNRNPAKYNYLADPAHPAGANPGWLTRSDVWVTYYGEATGGNRRGNLDANFGATGGQGYIGPEYGFGLVAGSRFADQVLIIKYAFGGKSLAVDYRPPGAVAQRGGAVGPNYTEMISRVHQVLDNIAAEFPAYSGQGYEICGFGWHQGWNDRVNASHTAEYEANLTNLIQDLRAEFGVSNLPVVIANTGMANAPSGAGSLIEAQGNVADPVKHPEFAGTVFTVDTRPFDYGELLGVNSQGYHWYFNGESHFNIGENMGQAMMAMLPSASLSAYESWSLQPAQGLTAGGNDGPDDDPDHDAIANLLEFALAGNPLVSSQAPLPALTATAGGWTFAYDRSVASRPPATTQVVEFGDDLSGWTPLAIPADTSDNVTIIPQGGTDRVEVTLPALGIRGFARLKVSQ